jgi:hypothetical protein
MKSVNPAIMLLVAVIALAVAVAPAEARRKKYGKAKTQVVERADGARFATGIVDSVGEGQLTVDGRRYDVKGASFVFAGGKPAPPSALRRGGKVSLTLNGKRATEVVVFPPVMIE